MDATTTAQYTVLQPGVRVAAEIERKKSRFLAVLTRSDAVEDAQALVDELRREHHAARHHCSAWVIGPDRRIQRANDDGEPSGTAAAPMLEALNKADMPGGAQDLSDAAVVVVRWFGGTLLGAGGLVSAYSDAVLAALEQARGKFLLRRRMRLFSLPAPIAQAGQWENELRSHGIQVPGADYTSAGEAALRLAVPDTDEDLAVLTARTAALTHGQGELASAGVEWVDVTG
ncbi:IMPACT family protein [Nesterenkonia populi]